MSRLVVIEGLDGSGKATQAARLAERLEAAGLTVLPVSFPNYKSNSSALVRMYLNGEFGATADSVNPYAASAFYAVDRYAAFTQSPLREAASADTLILADRYTTSNMIHQCAKLPPGEWPAFVAWLEGFEYEKLGIPKPDLVLYLDVEIEVSRRLLEKRSARFAASADIHEDDMAYLLKCRRAAHWCVERLGWQRVEGSRSGEMRPVEHITSELEYAINQHIYA